MFVQLWVWYVCLLRPVKYCTLPRCWRNLVQYPDPLSLSPTVVASYTSSTLIYVGYQATSSYTNTHILVNTTHTFFILIQEYICLENTLLSYTSPHWGFSLGQVPIVNCPFGMKRQTHSITLPSKVLMFLANPRSFHRATWHQSTVYDWLHSSESISLL